jgi:hypothetical protein
VENELFSSAPVLRTDHEWYGRNACVQGVTSRHHSSARIAIRFARDRGTEFENAVVMTSAPAPFNHTPTNRPRLATLAASLALVLATASLLSAREAHAEGIGVTRKVGLGLQSGVAPGFSAKAWVSQGSAVDFGVGFGLGDFACETRFNPCARKMSFNIDYLVHPGRAYGSPGFLAWHLGIGARVWFYEYGTTRDDRTIAARIPLGLDLMVLDFLEAFAEVAPSLAFNPARGFVEGTLGVRVYLF